MGVYGRVYEGYTRGIRGVYEGYTRGIRGAYEGIHIRLYIVSKRHFFNIGSIDVKMSLGTMH